MIKVYRLAKRIVDFTVSLLCMILFSPLLLILGLLIWIADGSPVIFSAKRVGKNKKLFTVYKFRTLKKGLKRRKDGLADKIHVSRLTQIMRDTHLDEVLQLFNVVKGDMALIGPRPLDFPRYNHLHSEDKTWDYILRVKPGMTCINQIARYSEWGMDKTRGLKGLKNMQRRNRLLLDKYYVNNESFALDTKITLWTFRYLIFGFFKKLFKKGESYW